MSNELASVFCQRCKHPMDPDAAQCDECGEIQTGGSSHTGKSVKELFGERGSGQAARPAARPVPVGSIAKWTVLGALALLFVSGLCFAGALVLDSLTLKLMQASTWLAAGAGAAFAVGFLTAVVWWIVNWIESWLLWRQALAEAREQVRHARLKAKTSYDIDAAKAAEGCRKLPTRPSPQVIVKVPPRPKANVPSQLTLVFAVLGILCGLYSLINALSPLFGMFIYKEPLILAVVFTVVAWTLCFFEQSQKLLPSVATAMIVAAVLTAYGQMLYWGKAAEEAGNEIKKYGETFRSMFDPGVANPFASPLPAKQQHVIIPSLNPAPTPPPTRHLPNRYNYPSRMQVTPAPQR